MARASLHLIFENGSLPSNSFKRTVPLPSNRDAQGEEYVAEHLGFELEKELRWGHYYSDLPDVQGLLQLARQTVRASALDTTELEDRWNTAAVWLEITNTLLRLKVLMARSRAYKDLEPQQSDRPEENQTLYRLHLTKMDHFDMATLLLAKVEDLTFRLIFENLGASIVSVNRDELDWEKELNWKNLKKGLKLRDTNPYLAALGDEEYSALRKILAAFRRPSFVRGCIRYRNRVAHRISPSVDYLELYVHLQDRTRTPLRDAQNHIVGWQKRITGRPKEPEYSFLPLYESTARTLKHYVTLLRRLFSMPRFGPEASR
jgi:hypothetical protein